jgi:hypothetical protein
MIRGTTPTLSFKLPFEISLLEVLYISMSQNGNVVIEKEISDCSIDGNTLAIKLTQEDTLKFLYGSNVKIQIRAKTKEGEAIASNIITTSVENILKNGVI